MRELRERGHQTRTLSRRGTNTGDDRRGDVLSGDGLPEALEGVKTAYYLVHCMGSGGDFAAKDRQAAINFAEAAKDVERVIYLGGLGSTDSEHLQSRHEVARELAARVPLVYVRAAMIIGPGSASYDILEHLVRRLPVMIVPRWLDTKTQPVALKDVIAALADVGERDDAPDEVQLGGAEVLTYREMMRRAAPLMGRRPPLVVRVPVLTPRLSSYWVALVTPVVLRADQAAGGRAGRGDARRGTAAARAQRRPARLRRRRPRSARMKLLNRHDERRIANAVIADPEQHTVMDAGGSVRSIQAANVDMPVDELEELWKPVNLERLARTYWKYLSRVTLGIIRVTYTEEERAVVVIGRPLVLLRFRAPEYDFTDGRGIVQWRIQDGLLVSRRNEGYLEIDVKRMESDRPDYGRIHVEVEVANFYPAIATWVARWFYANTQSRIHVLVTHGFLRSLARLELEESAVGRFAEDGERKGAVNVGDTPWQGVAALTLIVGVLVSSLQLRRARRAKKGWRRWS